MNWLFVVLTLIVLAYTFFNGFNNCGALVAAPIASRSMQPSLAMTLAVLALFAGPFLFGTAVASTIGEGLLRPHTLTLSILCAAVLAAGAWNILAWFTGFPSSTTHALIGGLTGAAIVGGGIEAISYAGFFRILAFLFLAPLLGFVISYVAMAVEHVLVQGAPLSINQWFKRLQLITTVGVALGNGTNNAQSSMAIMTLGLVTLHIQPSFFVPIWVTAAVALALAAGGMAGGYRVIWTVGGRIFRIQPIHAFTSQSVASAIMLTMSLIGYPLSTSQVITTAIMGVGAAERAHSVRWETVGDILVAWGVTIPAVALLAGVVYAVWRVLAGL